MSNKNTKGFRGIFKKMYKREVHEGERQKSHIVDSSQSMKAEKDSSHNLKERKEDHKEHQRGLSERKKEDVRERKREQELERQRRKELEREKEMERQRQLEWKQDLEKERQRERELEREHPKQEPSTSRKPPPEMTKFDEEFERDIEKLERQVCPLDFRSKTMATMWIDRLRNAPHNTSEARARNVITSHLLKCCGDNIFKKEPFNHPPPPENLATIRERMFLTRDSMCHGMPVVKQKNSHLTQLFNDSYDGGEFLSQLPVPRDGAFFIFHMHPNL
ncbi:zinc finger CCCH domain-containing protein 13 [Drosophila rhopaloa]|uniref:Zinc finger CCCH domain-containing protein 13 n=1 Tax=Drosophila rhopaloa TaxID=1041015 RepID=A0A6P4FGD7_DRORH|nr:zinc finger CCCH domain-containing protein 13 [Drosophila rhopaloa]